MIGVCNNADEEMAQIEWKAFENGQKTIRRCDEKELQVQMFEMKKVYLKANKMYKWRCI